MEDKQLIALFREKKLKVTTQRLIISKYLLSRKDHPSADQIYNALREEYPTISLGTVYKTLNVLKKIGLLHELGFGEGSIRYDPNTNLHINLICVKCESIEDYIPKEIDKWWETLTSNLDTKIVDQRIDIYHECEKCKNK